MNKKDKWELTAEIRDIIKHGGTEEHSKLARRMVRALKAESRYRRLMALLKEAGQCPSESIDIQSDSCPTSPLYRGECRKDVNKCWRLLVRKELDGK